MLNCGRDRGPQPDPNKLLVASRAVFREAIGESLGLFCAEALAPVLCQREARVLSYRCEPGEVGQFLKPVIEHGFGLLGAKAPDRRPEYLEFSKADRFPPAIFETPAPDLIFTSTALIEHDRKTAAVVLNNMYHILRPGGHLFVLLDLGCRSETQSSAEFSDVSIVEQPEIPNSFMVLRNSIVSRGRYLYSVASALPGEIQYGMLQGKFQLAAEEVAQRLDSLNLLPPGLRYDRAQLAYGTLGLDAPDARPGEMLFAADIIILKKSAFAPENN